MCSAEVMVMAAESLSRRPGGVRAACRRLFAADPGEAGRLAREAEAELRAQVAARWNFDFERERPLPGRYHWVAVGATQKSKRPKSTTTPVRPKKSKPLVNVNQHKITEFMRPTKRPMSESSSVSPHKLKMRRLNEELTTTATPAGST